MRVIKIGQYDYITYTGTQNKGGYPKKSPEVERKGHWFTARTTQRD